MPFEYSCFISYRHAKYKQARSYTDQIVEALKGELELRVNQEVFRDVERLRGGEFYNEALASYLCKSMCMIMLYWPTYFSIGHTFCSREFKAMEKLEKERLAHLSKLNIKTKGLIIVLAILDVESIPPEIRSSRLCYDFEPYTLRGSMFRNPEFKTKIREISEYISQLYRMFGNVPEASDIFNNCNDFTLPPESEILPWLRKVARPVSIFPTRGIRQ